MAIPQYSRVQVLTDRFRGEGVESGTVGWVIEIHEDEHGRAYEVEIMDDQGHTLALVVAKENELVVLPDDSR